MAESSTPVYETETVIKNEYDFRREILKALDNEFPSPSDAKDTELFRKRLLSALNQEFDQDDIKQTDRFRGKLVKGISDLAGGGSEFNTVSVNIVNDTQDEIIIYLPNYMYGTVFSMITCSPGMDADFDIILGSLGQAIGKLPATSGFTATGDVEIVRDSVTVSGSGSIHY